MLTDVPGFQRQRRASGEVLRGRHCCGIRLATTLLGLVASSFVFTPALVPGRSDKQTSIRRLQRISLITFTLSNYLEAILFWLRLSIAIELLSTERIVTAM